MKLIIGNWVFVSVKGAKTVSEMYLLLADEVHKEAIVFEDGVVER